MAAVDTATATRDNLVRILFLVTQIVSNPTQANVDAAVAGIQAGQLNGTLQLLPTSSIDGKSYNWGEYITSLQQAITAQTALIQVLGGPWIVRSRGAI